MLLYAQYYLFSHNTLGEKSPDNQLLLHEQYFIFKIAAMVLTLLMDRLL